MSHSTHIGFNEPLHICRAVASSTFALTIARAADPPSKPCGPPVAFATGVGHSDLFTARPSSFRLGPLLLPSWLNP